MLLIRITHNYHYLLLIDLFIFHLSAPSRFKISPDDNFSVIKDGTIHKLVIIRCEEEHTGKYRFEADHRKTEAMINVKGLTVRHENKKLILCCITGKVKYIHLQKRSESGLR